MVDLGDEDRKDLVLVEAWRTEGLFESYDRDVPQPALGAAISENRRGDQRCLVDRTAVVAAAPLRRRRCLSRSRREVARRPNLVLLPLIRQA